MFEYNYPVVDGLAVIANIGASSTQVILVNKGEFLYTRDIYLGGNGYNQRIMEALSVDFQNAETLKVSAGLGDQSVHGNVIQAISDVNDALVKEIQTTIEFFLQNEGGGEPMKPSMVFLTGGGARSLGLDAAIAAGFGIPVQILSPFQRIKLGTTSKHTNILMAQGPVYSTALGLALREVDDSRAE
jgi:type IV pilus assembly protein PilM